MRIVGIIEKERVFLSLSSSGYCSQSSEGKALSPLQNLKKIFFEKVLQRVLVIFTAPVIMWISKTLETA